MLVPFQYMLPTEAHWLVLVPLAGRLCVPSLKLSSISAVSLPGHTRDAKEPGKVEASQKQLIFNGVMT
jgi:hypothetical protein